MAEIRPLPSPGDVFTDIRGGDRTMRVSYHADREVVVVSLWAGGLCRGSFRLALADLDRLTSVLAGMHPAPTTVGLPAIPDAAAAPTPSPGPASPGAEAVDVRDGVEGTGDVLRSALIPRVA
ncbi:MAG TPA: hypothetical protein VJT31_21805 [Rugosimonospora sp.]|nr:hypothetical protein [Rugosimonospora sp.]